MSGKWKKTISHIFLQKQLDAKTISHFKLNFYLIRCYRESKQHKKHFTSALTPFESTDHGLCESVI